MVFLKLIGPWAEMSVLSWSEMGLSWSPRQEWMWPQLLPSCFWPSPVPQAFGYTNWPASYHPKLRRLNSTETGTCPPLTKHSPLFTTEWLCNSWLRSLSSDQPVRRKSHRCGCFAPAWALTLSATSPQTDGKAPDKPSSHLAHRSHLEGHYIRVSRNCVVTSIYTHTSHLSVSHIITIIDLFTLLLRNPCKVLALFRKLLWCNFDIKYSPTFTSFLNQKLVKYRNKKV